MAGSRGKKANLVAALQRRLQERLPNDDTWKLIMHQEEAAGKAHPYDDRATAIILSAILEQYLEDAICTHFAITAEDEVRPLFDDSTDGPLSTLARKISLGYALGVYGAKMRADLTCIRRIRNAFAHSKIHLEFTTKEITDLCDCVFLPTTFKGPRVGDLSSKGPRQKFISTVKFIYVYLLDDRGPINFKTNSYRTFYGPIP